MCLGQAVLAHQAHTVFRELRASGRVWCQKRSVCRGGWVAR